MQIRYQKGSLKTKELIHATNVKIALMLLDFTSE